MNILFGSKSKLERAVEHHGKQLQEIVGAGQTLSAKIATTDNVTRALQQELARTVDKQKSDIAEVNTRLEQVKETLHTEGEENHANVNGRLDAIEGKLLRINETVQSLFTDTTRNAEVFREEMKVHANELKILKSNNSKLLNQLIKSTEGISTALKYLEVKMDNQKEKVESLGNKLNDDMARCIKLSNKAFDVVENEQMVRRLKENPKKKRRRISRRLHPEKSCSICHGKAGECHHRGKEGHLPPLDYYDTAESSVGSSSA